MELKKVECDPACGFMVRSHDESEIVSDVISHVKKAHQKEVTTKEVMKMMMVA